MDINMIFWTVCLIGFGVFYSSRAYKTEEEIMLEIKSMAAKISSECSSPSSPRNCYSSQKKVVDAKSLPILCSAMDAYLKCQDIICQNQTITLTDLLTDAMVIPYCTQMLNVPVEEDLQEVSSQVAALNNLCTFLPGQNCDLYLNRVLESKTLDRACIAESYYVECLRLRCEESNNLTQQIVMTVSTSPCGSRFNHPSSGFKTEVDIMVEIKSMATAILSECSWPRFPELCYTYKNKVDQAKSLKKMCSAMDVYIFCQDTNCLNQSRALMDVLTDAMVIPYCTQMLNVPVEEDLQEVSSQVAAMTHLCTFLPGQNCDLYLNIVLESKTLDRACIAQRSYVECLRLKCVQSHNLTQQIETVLTSSPCASFTSSTQSIRDQNNQGSHAVRQTFSVALATVAVLTCLYI